MLLQSEALKPAETRRSLEFFAARQEANEATHSTTLNSKSLAVMRSTASIPLLFPRWAGTAP
jgi:hypothetical protein